MCEMLRLRWYMLRVYWCTELRLIDQKQIVWLMRQCCTWLYTARSRRLVPSSHRYASIKLGRQLILIIEKYITQLAVSKLSRGKSSLRFAFCANLWAWPVRNDSQKNVDISPRWSRKQTAKVLAHTGKKAVVRLGDIASRGQFPRLAPALSAFVRERRDTLAFSVPKRARAFNFAARNYLFCRYYTIYEKLTYNWTLHSAFHPSFLYLRFLFNFFLC